VLTAVLAAAMTVWVVDFAAGLLLSDHETAEGLNAVLLTIIGGVFALQAKRNGSGGSGKNGAGGGDS